MTFPDTLPGAYARHGLRDEKELDSLELRAKMRLLDPKKIIAGLKREAPTCFACRWILDSMKRKDGKLGKIKGGPFRPDGGDLFPVDAKRNHILLCAMRDAWVNGKESE